MKKLLLVLALVILSFAITACDPNTTVIPTTVSNSIDLEHIGLELDKNEVCQGAIVTLTPFYSPTNASNLGYTITFSEQNVVQFVAGSNNGQIEVIGEPAYMDQGTVGFITITITSDFNLNIDNTERLYIYATGIQPPQCIG